jgi:spore coat protein A
MKRLVLSRLLLSAASGLAVCLLGASSAFSQLVPLNPATQAKFVNPLPIPAVAQPVDALVNPNYYEMKVTQFQQWLGLKDPVTKAKLQTKLWGYGDAKNFTGTYPGPTFVAYTGTPIQVKWINDLRSSYPGGPILTSHILPVDPTALDPNNPLQNPASIVPHLHGGHVGPAADGTPLQYFSPDGLNNGSAGPPAGQNFVVDDYPNDQDSATLWYHDHAMGVTRLNPYSGMAGFYLLLDAADAALNMPGGAYQIGLAIQDKSFWSDGSLLYPSGPATPGVGGLTPPAISVVPEFFGDFMLVNGMTWPKLDVEPRKYRFRMLNGCNSRFLNVKLVIPVAAAVGPDIVVPMYQVGSEQGLLPVTAKHADLLLAPGERADIIVDFSALAGKSITMYNNAKTPYPTGVAPVAGMTQVMRFNVIKPLLRPDTSIIPETPRPLTTLTPNAPTRHIWLGEDLDVYGRLRQTISSGLAPAAFMDPVTETPKLNTTEIWEFTNTTMDTHPLHLHLVRFQVLDRQNFNTLAYVNGNPATLQLTGDSFGPRREEMGWKDTVQMPPGMVTRIIAKFDILGEYVYHCHILEHEEHDMMRPFQVVP